MDTSLQTTEKYYACIDLKCFYASVECVERGLDPFKVNLVVADPARGRGAICLAISPTLKRLGVRNRCRLYEIPSWISYITALPRMRKYMEYSSAIYRHYLDFLSAEDIYVYSELYLEVVIKDAPIRKLAVNANNLIWLGSAEQSLFSTYDVDEEKDRDMQQALLDIKGKYGKNSILRGIS